MPYTEAEEKIIAKNLARTDVRISQLSLAILFGGLFLLPRDWFWFWFIPLAAFYVRMHWLVMKREEALADAISLRKSGLAAAGRDRGERRIPMTQCAENIRIVRQ